MNGFVVLKNWKNFLKDLSKDTFHQSESGHCSPAHLTFVDEDLDLAESEVLLVLAVVPQVHELTAVTLVLVAVEQRLLILE